ncbi:quorum sensing histidine kinase QseC [Uliginosibacterium sp. sgz301328]|uniref:quorum sensing histidine kinase QseC n=1 Tax=Uliginosibacterium sp. sgz301328 TaxID=3243764 RepID=UPI00359D32CB
MRPASLRVCLSLLITVVLVVAWVLASAVSYRDTRSRVSELFDRQQTLLAQQLLDTDIQNLVSRPAKDRQRGPLRLRRRGADRNDDDAPDDAMGFAIFDAQGTRLFSDGRSGGDYAFDPARQGFMTQPLGGRHHAWRLYYAANADRSLFVVVGQEIGYRRSTVLGIVRSQFLPWAIALPVLLALVWWGIGRMLAPLDRVAGDLRQRAPDDARPIPPRGLPSEVRPLIDALNALFARVAETLTRERRFIADAAHELRSPLAALRVQAEVAQIARDPTVRSQALDNLNEGVDRASRLVDQLLSLSRLGPMQMPADAKPIDWRALAESARDEMAPMAASRDIGLSLQVAALPPATRGDAMLLGLMLRNLLDNALRYTPAGGHVELVLDAEGIRVVDDGPGVPEAYMSRIRERFFRPPGQNETGSGLGLSIVERIATLHGMRLQLDNRAPHGLVAAVVRPSAADRA